ncbi:hypothetical protein B0T16DRAFT_457748 [Cercophora newfieldiana]|uniref:Uncharacterized protein n=1 Tax=Cercophora newfieldiana TaxID=92897 RepID=A0AA39Y4F3_9PEZI|nr:hypothetical protein B0T16DRAFT_457748 [Cercophora newfieldiana]
MSFDSDYGSAKLAQAIIAAQAAVRPAKKNWGNPAPLVGYDLTPLSCGFFLALGATLTPGFNAEVPYMTGSSAILNATFFNSFGFFYLFVGLLSFVFFICSFRTNICLVILFLAYTIAFPLLAAAEWKHAEGQMALSHRLTVGVGAACFVVSAASWWAMIGGLLESVDFPFTLPMGDLSRVFPSGASVLDVEAASPSKME